MNTERKIEYAKIEVRIDGVTHVYEFEHDDGYPITGKISTVRDVHEMPEEFSQPFRTFEGGPWRVEIRLSGPVLRLSRGESA